MKNLEWGQWENSGTCAGAQMEHKTLHNLALCTILYIDSPNFSYMVSTVFFKISDKQDAEVKSLMNDEGYTNKAEFFRFLIKFYKYTKNAGDVRFEKAVDQLATTLRKLDAQGKLGESIEDQLSDI